MTDPGEPEGSLWADPSLIEGIVRTAASGIVVLDPDGTVRFANERAEEILGRSLEELDAFAADDPRWGFVDEDGGVLPDERSPFRRLLDDRSSFEEQVVGLSRPDGNRVWISASGSTQRDRNGDLERAILTFEDVTDRKRREMALERERRRFEAVFEDPNILVGLLDPDGTVLDINETAMEYVDTDLESVTGRPFWETPWWGEGDGIQTDVREWTERAAAGEYVDFEADLTRPDGERYSLSGYFRPVTDEDGEVVSIIVSDRDITERKRRERDLEESERRYRALVDNFPNGAVTLVDEDLRYQTVGGNPTDIAGSPAEQLEGRPVREAVPDALADELVPRYEAAFDGESSPFEVELRGRVFQLQVVPVRDDDGEVFAALGMSQDITDRKRFEESIHDLHETTRRLFRAESEDAVARTVVTAARDVLGLSDIALYLHDEHRDDLYPAAKATAVDVMWEDLPRVPVDDETIVGHVFATGESVRWDDIRESPHFIGAETDMRAGVYSAVGDHGAIFAGSDAVGAFDDQTLQLLELLAANAEAAFDRVERARKLEESERRYRTLVETFPNGAVGLFDEDLRYQAAGGSAFDDVGASTDDIVGKTIWERYPEALAEQLAPKFRAALDGETNAFEMEFHDRHWLTYTVPVRDDDGDVFAGMVMVQDVTERREYRRRLEESNERLEQFAYAVSHDLQEPLRMVSSYLQLLEDRYAGDLDADAEEFIAFAVDGADRMREMIEGLLRYSRVETEGEPLEPVDLDAVLDAVRRDLQVSIEESGATITTEELPTVEGDADQLRQVFQNLLDNAIEYSDERPSIHVSAEREGDEWLISVSDEGIGIGPDSQDRIFEVFQRLHTQEEHEGTGIGLALCERIVERHGGDIWAESEPGEGTTISFTLPAVSGDETEN